MTSTENASTTITIEDRPAKIVQQSTSGMVVQFLNHDMEQRWVRKP